MSIVSLSIQKEANELQKRQVIINEILNMPVFNVSYRYYESYVYNGIPYSGCKEINIINSGGNISGGYLYAKSQIEVVIYDEYEKIGVIVINDLNGYIKSFSYYDASSKDFIIRKNNVTRNIELCRLIESELTNKYKMYNFTAMNVDYVNLCYTDFQDDAHDEWYKLSNEKLIKTEPTHSKQHVTIPIETKTDEEIYLIIEKIVNDMLLVNVN